MTPDLLGGIVGAILSVLILTYILGDNPLYRLALYALIGASVGYVVAVVVASVLRIALPALQQGGEEAYRLLIPLVLGIVLLFKGFTRWSPLANLSTAFLLGVGSAVAVGGALLGTVLPQVSAAGTVWEWLQGGGPGLLNGLIGLGGTVCALLAFTFTLRRRPGAGGVWSGTVGVLGGVGRLFLLAAFGAAFAGALIASLTVLVGRVYSVVGGLLEAWRLLGG